MNWAMVNIVFASIDLMIIKVNGVNVTVYIISIVNILIVLVRDLWGSLMMVRCRFAYKCPHYGKEKYTCSDDDEAVIQGYCGFAREFKHLAMLEELR